MKRFLKSSLSIFLAITIIFSSAIVGLNELDFNEIKFDNPFAIETKAASESDLTFELNGDGKSYSVIDCDTSAEGVLVIPSTYKGLFVTSIGYCAFEACTELTSITIPDRVTSIGSDAFEECTSLASITVDSANEYYSSVDGILFNKDKTMLIQYPNGKPSSTYIIPDSVTSIGSDAFEDCTSLTSITIPDSVTSIGSSAFNCCKNLTTITLPDSVTSIGMDAFRYCTSLTSISIPSSVTSIYGGAFEGCTSLAAITIPDSVTTIGDFAFKNCTSLTSITIPDSVTSIGTYAFKGCTSLAAITIPDSVTSISFEAFGGCTRLTSITIPDSVTSIGNYAFSGCTSLTSITIPDSVTSIGNYAFSGCTSLTSITIPDSVTSIGRESFFNTGYYNDESNWENGVLYINNHLIAANRYDEENYEYIGNVSGNYAVKKGTRTIAGDAFYKCTNLTSIEIPDSVTSIGNSAFEKCTGLTSIETPNSVTSIGYWAFRYCTSLTSISIPSSVTSIGNSAFENCTSLTSIEIPDSVASIGYDAFLNTSYYNDENNWDNGVLYVNNHLIAANKYDEENDEYIGNVSGDYAIKKGTRTIAASAFCNCTSLTSITMPDSVISIGDWAFENCECLRSIAIPDSVTSIGYGAFYNCISLKTVTIGNGVTSIDHEAFYKCKSLTTITIPDSVTSIGCGAFSNCIRLKTVTIGNGVTSISDDAFYKCTSLTAITIPNSVTSIGNSAFEKCTGLTAITIPNTVTSISDDAFYGCTDLIIYGCENSYAQKYAKENGISFVKIDCVEHTLSDWVIDKNPTCSEEGSHFKYCTVCGVTLETETIAKNAHIESEWITDEKATVYKAGSKHKECTVCGEELDTAPIKQLKCDKPTLKSISNTEYGVKITWGKVKGGDTYVVYRKTGSGSYTKIGTTKNTYYTDKKAKSGTKYYYYIKAENEAGTSPASSSKSILHLAVPTLKSISNTEYGVKIAWGKVTGAEKYYIYRKTKSGSYSKIGTTKNAYYTDRKAKSGKKYYYIVKAVNEAGISSASKAKSILHLADPTLKKVTNSEYGVKITWSKVSGADKYYVCRKVKGGSYSKLATTKNAYYTDKKAKSGKKYYYVVKAVKGSVTSASSNEKSIVYLADPTLKTPSSTKSGITLKWSKVTGAEGYIIYRKTGSGSYTKLKTEKDVSNLAYTDKSAKKGKTYTYKVKAYKGKTYSAYSNAKKIKDKY